MSTRNRVAPKSETNRLNSIDRYSRQTNFRRLGEDGQRRLLESRVAICGCGALGSVQAEALARAGVGFLRIIDRDFVELSNLQRQALYDEEDCASGMPKAQAAASKLANINSQITIEPVVTDMDYRNIHTLCGDVDLILDGTDNFETRFLINDFSHQKRVPWIYGGCIGSEGQTMSIVPGETACLRCLMGSLPPPGTTPTCETAGILGPIAHIIGNFQAAEAIKFLSGNREALNPDLLILDIWENRSRRISLKMLEGRNECPTCGRGNFEWLSGKAGSQTATLCGRNAVQVVPAEPHPVDFDHFLDRLPTAEPVLKNRYLLRFNIDGFEVSLFGDGRAIIKGTDDPTAARSLYARYIGS